MKVLVTGGAGFIGSHLVDKLLKEGHEVTVYDNLSWGKEEFLKEHYGEKNFRFLKGDLLDSSSLRKAVKGQEFIHHLAANPDIRKGAEETELDLKQNVLTTFNLLEAMRACGVKQIAFSSSSTVYGEARTLPTPEDYGPLLPISLYGASKLAAEGLISAYCHTFGFRAWIFRFANIVGPRQTHGVIVDFIEKLRKNPEELEILGDGNQNKSYLWVEDCVEAMLLAVERSTENPAIFNLGNTDRTTVRRVAEIVCEEMGLQPRFRFTGGRRGWVGDVPEMLLDITKICSLGWRPRYSSEEAVKRTVRVLLGRS
ncbi:MAG: NAD-dependent epimerase/dehydratase family protein [Candidatus Hadarchaeales archaeon]